jgi:hypothetical protein
MSALTLLGAFALYVTYELGRYDAGYDRQAVAQQRTELEVAIERLEKANLTLRTQLAKLDTIRVGHAHEQAEVSREIGDLQAQVARQSQELAFYRGVVSQSSTSLGVKIQEPRVFAGKSPGDYVVHVALLRSGRPEGWMSGSLALSLDGQSKAAPATLDLAALTAGRHRELTFRFRYLQTVEQELSVPADFKPEHLNIEVRSSQRDTAPLTQTFAWNVSTSPPP